MMNFRKVANDRRWREKRIADHVVVHVMANMDEKLFSQILTNHGATVHQVLHQIDRRVLSVDTLKIFDLIKELSDSNLIQDAEPNSIGGSAIVPNDPGVGQQWYLNDMHIPDAWEISTGSPNITLAVLDSGCYQQHPDLTNLVPGWNYVLGNSDTTDTGALGGHGTAVSGCAAAVSNNGTGLAGTAYNCKIMPLVVLSASDFASWSNLASAIMYAADHGCRVINISICGTSGSSMLDSASNYAWSKGSVIIAAAGNNSNSNLVYPAACPNVLSVAATGQDGNLTNFSTFGSWVNVAAPGTPIYTTTGANGYSSWWGTSFSSPITCGIAVLMIAAYPAITNAQVVSILKSTTDPVPNQPFGKVNALKALMAVKALMPPPVWVAPSLTITSNQASAPEGNSGTTPFTFSVTRSGDLTKTAAVSYVVTGTDANDFGGTFPSGNVSFATGQTSATITINVVGDTVFETDDMFTVTLSSPINAVIAQSTASAIILNDDVAPVLPTLSISADQVSKPEGNSGVTPFTFTVTRSGDLTNTSTVNYAVTGGTPDDFALPGGSLPFGSVSFGIGQGTAPITISVMGDTTVEPDEPFTVTLSSPVGATIAVASATSTILNDDVVLPPPSLAISANQTSKPEGNSGVTPFTFTVTRSGDLTVISSVKYNVSGGSTNDYVGGVFPSGTVGFVAGQSLATITINVVGDTTVEPDEPFVVTLSSSVGATIAVASATSTITNDDVAPLPPTVRFTSPANNSTTSNTTITATVQITLNGTGKHVVTVTDTCSGLSGSATLTINRV